jgi:vacuolar-type H+-ATPase subunit H
MPLYHLALHDGECAFADEGVWLANGEQAIEHAHHVAHELMQSREPQTRSWRIDIYEDGRQLHRVPFATIDPTLDHLGPQVRATVEALWESIHSAKQIVAAARATARESRALVRRSRGKPYLATERGQPTIRASRPPGAGIPQRGGGRKRGGLSNVRATD